jgi:hypothetical protein
MDIDSIPIGVKPTNQMNFEELVEEKLKIADQLEEEQKRLNLYKFKQHRKSHNMSSNAEIDENSCYDEDNNKSDSIHEYNYNDHGENESMNKNDQIQPKKFLKKGEGLKKYLPKPKDKKQTLRQQQHQQANNKSNNTNKNSKTNTNRTVVTSKTLSSNSTSNLHSNASKTSNYSSSDNNTNSKKNPRKISSKNVSVTPTPTPTTSTSCMSNQSEFLYFFSIIKYIIILKN